MRSLWRKLPEPMRHLMGALAAVLIMTLPLLVLGLDHRCVQLINCHHERSPGAVPMPPLGVALRRSAPQQLDVSKSIFNAPVRCLSLCEPCGRVH
jgi:hypothetical protein